VPSSIVAADRLPTVASVVEDVRRWRQPESYERFPAPRFEPPMTTVGNRARGELEVPTDSERHMLALKNFERHMTNEGWQMQEGLRGAGYELHGKGYDDLRDVGRLHALLGSTVVVQDQREWDPNRAGCFDKDADFVNVGSLASRPDIFRVAVHKDVHQDQAYHRASHAAIQPHAWITYYHTDIVLLLCPWLRREHVIRTTHTVDPAKVAWTEASLRRRCLLSGSMSAYYPLRQRCRTLAQQGELGDVEVLRHPGYNDRGSQTDTYLQILSRYRAAICTASRLGFSLRKLIEATCCGARVITDLPVDDVMGPGVEQNLTRVPRDIGAAELKAVIDELNATYDEERQRRLATWATEVYDYREVGRTLAHSIETLRREWPTC